MALKYVVEATIDGRFWLLSVPAIGQVTQARNLTEVPVMARDLIEITTGEAGVELDVCFTLPEAVRAHLERAAVARAREEQSRSEAAAELRAAARELRAKRMSFKDVGQLLGVSHQRAHQLVKS